MDWSFIDKWKSVGIIVLILAACGIASRFVFKKTDNIVEEMAERAIKEKTGYDIDLSPDTPDYLSANADYFEES